MCMTFMIKAFYDKSMTFDTNVEHTNATIVEHRAISDIALEGVGGLFKMIAVKMYILINNNNNTLYLDTKIQSTNSVR